EREQDEHGDDCRQRGEVGAAPRRSEAQRRPHGADSTRRKRKRGEGQQDGQADECADRCQERQCGEHQYPCPGVPLPAPLWPVEPAAPLPFGPVRVPVTASERSRSSRSYAAVSLPGSARTAVSKSPCAVSAWL